MRFYRLCLLLILLVFDAVYSAECDGPNKVSCLNVFKAIRCGLFDTCVRVWRTSTWIKYKDDLSAACTHCRALAPHLSNTAVTSTLCASMPSVDRAQCEKTVSSLKGVENHGVCNVLTICESHTYLGDLNFGSDLCDDCKRIITDVRNLITDNATSEAIINKLDDVFCSHVPEHYRDFCKENIKVHVPYILNITATHICPVGICTLLNLCPKSNIIRSITDRIIASPDQGILLQDLAAQTKYSWLSRPTPNNSPMWTSYDNPSSKLLFSSVPSCDQCVAVLSQIKTALTDPALQIKMKHEITEKICSRLDVLLKEMCITAVEEKFTDMISAIEKANVYEACQTFSMCPASAQPSLALSYPVVCPLCESIITELLHRIPLNATMDVVKQGLKEVCTILPNVPDCPTIVDFLVDAVVHGLSPKIFCMTFGLCSSQTSKPANAIVELKEDSFCSTCKLIVQVGYHMLLENKTVAQLEHVLKLICNAIHNPYATECENLIDQYLPKALEYFEKKFTPEQVCKEIGMCPLNREICFRGQSYWCQNRQTAAFCNATSFCENIIWKSRKTLLCETKSLDEICSSLELAANCDRSTECVSRRVYQSLQLLLSSSRSTPSSSVFHPDCTICKRFASKWKIQKLFGAPTVNADTCLTFRDDKDKTQCELVLKNKEAVVGMINQDHSNIEAICTELGLCPLKLSSLLKACIESPSFRCSSPRAAEQCGSVNYCKTYVWPTHGKKSTNADPNLDVFGNNAQEWGAVYCCQSEEKAAACGEEFVRFCKTWQQHKLPKH